MKQNGSRIAIALVAVGLFGGLIGLLRLNSAPPVPLDKAQPEQINPNFPAGSEPKAAEKGDKPEKPEVAFQFDNGNSPDSEKTMRFGLFVLAVKDERMPTGYKQLTWHPEGITSNACLKIDGDQLLFGHAPGKWVEMEAKLGKDENGKKRLGRKSVWLATEKIQVTQTVEIVRGSLTGKLDICKVAYLLENLGDKPRQVGLRFLLDTFIGTNDGAPFIVPGRDLLCEKQMQFKTAANVPPFVFALEQMKLNDPGVVAQIGLKLPQAEAPVLVTLGGWPDEKKVKGAKGGLTLWDVPVFPIDKFNDSAAAIYWAEKELAPGGKRSLAFTYGLGLFSANKDGSLGMFLAGEPHTDGTLVVTALLKDAEIGQKLTLKESAAFQFVDCTAEQAIMLPPAGRYPFGPVSWTLRPTQAGKLPLRIDASGVSHEYTVTVSK